MRREMTTYAATAPGQGTLAALGDSRPRHNGDDVEAEIEELVGDPLNAFVVGDATRCELVAVARMAPRLNHSKKNSRRRG